MGHAIEEGETIASALAEEFAYDSLVDRLPWHDELALLIVQYGQGTWTSQFDMQRKFLRTLRDEDAAKIENVSEPASSSSAIINAHVWDRAKPH